MDQETKERKKRGLLGKVFISAPCWWFRGWKTIGKGVIALDQQKRLISHTRNNARFIAKSLRALHAPRDPNGPDAPDMRNFRKVLAHWGITRRQLPLVIRGIKLQITAYSILGLLSAAGLYWGVKTVSWWPIVNGGMVLVMSSVVVIGRYWRLQVLQAERFFSFRAWITGRVN